MHTPLRTLLKWLKVIKSRLSALMLIKCSYLAQHLILSWDNIPVNGRSELKHPITLSDLLSHILHCSEWMSSILADAWGDIFKLLSYSFYYVLVCVLYRRRHRAMHHRASPANGDFFFFFFVLHRSLMVVKSPSIKSFCGILVWQMARDRYGPYGNNRL